jgi:2-keto-3-deoxy-L-rhamnonate aldolase RhmA
MGVTTLTRSQFTVTVPELLTSTEYERESLGDVINLSDGHARQPLTATQEAIMARAGVDGCWIGLSDRAVSLGIQPRDAAGNARHQQAMARVPTACHDTGTIPGFASYTPEEARLRAEQGFRFLTVGSDLEIVLAGARAGLEPLR